MKISTTMRLLGAASALAMTTGAAAQVVPSAAAQDDPAPAPTVAAGSAEPEAAADIVVTGTSTRQRKFDAPYSVSTIDAGQIAQAAPHSVADLLGATPGITVEASGGEGGGENVVIRGLPWSGWRLIDFTQDGMPLFESNTERFMNIDQFYRVDLDTQRVEVVRGGTAPLFSNNASGGVVNFITNHGTDTYQGALRLGSGTGNRTRTDLAVSTGATTDCGTPVTTMPTAAVSSNSARPTNSMAAGSGAISSI
jgi:outer membrane receptor protein involved in Fe transport